MNKKKISVLTPCYNEEANLELLYKRIKQQFDNQEKYTYEHIFIDNCSTDNSKNILRKLAENDKNVKVIFNNRNFGPNRSGAFGLLTCYGDAVINLAADLQDPPELIPQFIKEWENGYKVIYGKKRKTGDGIFMKATRKIYYKIMSRISDYGHYENVTGFGMFDSEVIEMLRWINDPLVYYRGILSELGYPTAFILYDKQPRYGGKSSYTLLKYVDDAITGVTSCSKKPLRILTILGTLFSFLFFIIALIYFILKLLYWDTFDLGLSPILIGMFLIGSIQLAFLGLIGEYIASIVTKVTKRPLITVKERLNFEDDPKFEAEGYTNEKL